MVYVPGYGYVPDDYTPGKAPAGPKPVDRGQAPRVPQQTQTEGGWREQLLPGYQKPGQQPAVAPTGGYSTTANGTFQFNQDYGGAAASTGITSVDGTPLADIYFYQQPVGTYTPGTFYGADRTEREIGAAGTLYTSSTIGEALASYWNDPIANAKIVEASREYYKAYSNWNPQWSEGFWSDIVNIAASTGAHPGTILDKILSGEVTPPTDSSSSSSGGYGSYGGGGYGGGGSGSQQISLTNPTAARGLLLQTMQSVLGRNPTEQEYKDFITTLNDYERSNPQTAEVDGDSVTYSGGVDPGVIAQEFAQNAEDYKSSQARQYFNTFMQALGGASGG